MILGGGTRLSKEGPTTFFGSKRENLDQNLGGFILRVRQRCDGFAMSLSTSLSQRQRTSLLTIASENFRSKDRRSRVEIILTF